ncbi:MAG TPA: hypothetical protein VII06_23425 [Chloroflexota bacterium]
MAGPRAQADVEAIVAGTNSSLAAVMAEQEFGGATRLVGRPGFTGPPY